MKRILLLLSFLPQIIMAQSKPSYIESINKGDDPALIVQEYQNYYRIHPFEKNQHTQTYKRWLRGLSRSVLKPDADYQNRYLSKQRRSADSWVCIGPWDFDKEAASRSYAPGAAHVYTVEKSLSNPSVLYAGTATAGLWRSNDNGGSWELLTKSMFASDVIAIEINHLNENCVYFESGGEIFKSVDGGLNWVLCGDSSFNAQSHECNDILMHPSDTSKLYFATTSGLFITSDGGYTFTLLQSGDFLEIEFKPDSPDVVYAVKKSGNKTIFYRAEDGITFVPKPNGWPNPQTGEEQERTELAVSPADPNVVYAYCTGAANGGSGTYGLYFSDDLGENWTFRCCGNQPAGVPSQSNPNLMAWAQDGTEDGGQYYYDVAFAVDPTDINKVHVGGVNHWVSTDGGFNFVCPATWAQPHQPGYIHADIHDIRYFGNEIWVACDGGIFVSNDNGSSFNRSMFGIEGSDFWGFGVSLKGDVMLGGAYHNGTLLKDRNVYENEWICTGGGDGVRGFVALGNDRKVMDDWGGRTLSGDRNVANGTYAFDSLPNASYIVGFSSEIVYDPDYFESFYLGRGKNLLKTVNNGQSYSIVKTFNGEVMSIEIPYSDKNRIYVTLNNGWNSVKQIWKSVDAGLTWINITPTSSVLGGDTWVPYDIAVNANVPDEIVMTRTSMYGNTNLNGRMVYKSLDGGQSWQNITTSMLNGEVPTVIVAQDGTNGGIYLGTRRSVYYRNNTMTDWEMYSNGLPFRVNATRLVVNYNLSKIRNATERSVYEAEFYELSAPAIRFAANKPQVSCLDNAVSFLNLSIGMSSSVSYNWVFQGGTPATSSIENPTVSYNAPGVYDVTLEITDTSGSYVLTKSQLVTFSDNSNDFPFSEDFESGDLYDWHISNPNATAQWALKSVTNGPSCGVTNCMFVNNYENGVSGHDSHLASDKIQLNTQSGLLLFDYAYARYSGSYNDRLMVLISENCGSNWDTLFDKTGSNLATAPDLASWYEPANCDEWMFVELDLSAYINKEIMIDFVNISDYGNNLYLDNINISDGTNVAFNSQQFAIYPNPMIDRLVFKGFKNGNVQIYNQEGKLVFTSNLTKSIETVDPKLSNGMYLVKVIDSEHVYTSKLVVAQ